MSLKQMDEKARCLVRRVTGPFFLVFLLFTKWHLVLALNEAPGQFFGRILAHFRRGGVSVFEGTEMFQDGQRETATWEMSHVARSILELVLARWHWDVAPGAEAAAGDGDPPGQLSVAPVLGPKDAAKAAVAVE